MSATARPRRERRRKRKKETHPNSKQPQRETRQSEVAMSPSTEGSVHESESSRRAFNESRAKIAARDTLKKTCRERREERDNRESGITRANQPRWGLG